jgi:hypothetical protein
MSRDGRDADLRRTMTTALLLQRRAGRFGREIEPDRVAAGAERDLVAIDYEVGEDAVAAAIVERLVAGRTIRVPRRRG